MNLEDFQILINALPVKRQCFTTKRATWKKAELAHPFLYELNQAIFGDNHTVTLSRNDVFQTKDVRLKIIKTIYWGYPRGMRGNHFFHIMQNLDSIESTLTEITSRKSLSREDWNTFHASMSRIKGIGISTYSKLLYFSPTRFNDLPALIMDNRLMTAFNKRVFEAFSFPYLRPDNAADHYMSYLKQIDQESRKLQVPSENIELFLFMFGNNLK